MSYENKKKNRHKSFGKISAIVKHLSGIINLPDNFNHKKEYSDYLVQKYN